MNVAQERFWRQRDEHEAARQNLWAAFALACPPGAEVQWERAGHHQVGRVIRHGYNGDLWVTNKHTRKDVKLHAADLLR